MNDHAAQATPAVLLSWQSGVARVVLNRPKARNAIDESMIRSLEDIFASLARNDDLRAVVLSGAAGHFCAGADVRMIQSGLADPYSLFRLHDRLTALGCAVDELPVPVIAALCGSVFGGGAELALCCDIRLAGKSVQFAFPEARLGIMPGTGGTARLARIVGRQRAMHLELTGHALDATACVAAGLALEEREDAEVEDAALALAGQIAQAAPAAVRQIKRSMRLAMEMPLRGAIDYCQFAAMLLATTADAAEGIGALREKRTPVFRGR